MEAFGDLYTLDFHVDIYVCLLKQAALLWMPNSILISFYLQKTFDETRSWSDFPQERLSFLTFQSVARKKSIGLYRICAALTHSLTYFPELLPQPITNWLVNIVAENFVVTFIQEIQKLIHIFLTSQFRCSFLHLIKNGTSFLQILCSLIKIFSRSFRVVS